MWDTTITEILAGVNEPDTEGRRPPASLYGCLKTWPHLRRQGISVARCTVERIVRTNGWRGATRARRKVCDTAFVIDAYAGLIAGWECRRGPSHTLADPENITFGVGALVQHEQTHAPTRAPTTRKSRVLR